MDEGTEDRDKSSSSDPARCLPYGAKKFCYAGGVKKCLLVALGFAFTPNLFAQNDPPTALP
jgi:hypothetical protein